MTGAQVGQLRESAARFHGVLQLVDANFVAGTSCAEAAREVLHCADARSLDARPDHPVALRARLVEVARALAKVCSLHRRSR